MNPNDYDVLSSNLSRKGLDVAVIERRLATQRIETPSWGYANSGTRFGVFPQEGVPRDPYEKLADAAEVHRHTGITPSVAIHIPWDKVDDFGQLKRYAASLGLTLGAVNPNLFQDDAYKLGSLTNPDPGVREKATDHVLECIAMAQEIGSDSISLWLADGTNYPGQDSLAGRRSRMMDCLRRIYETSPDGMRILVEYKFFEPAFYHTDIADWGSALLICQKLGPRAQVLVDLGHHAQGTNVEAIVSTLLDEGRLGGFHFNNRKYADDDLIVGSVNPFELFLIYVELVRGELRGANTRLPIAYMIDQSHNIEPKIEAMIQSVVNLQETYAKALLVDWNGLDEANASGDVLGGHRILLDAFATDVRPLCAKVRVSLGASWDPIAAFKESGYIERIRQARIGGSQAGWG